MPVITGEENAVHDLEETLSVLRHELTTPLTVIETALSSLDHDLDRLSEDVRGLVLAARRQLDVAQAIIDDLHVAAKEDLTLDLERVDLRQLTRSYVEQIGPAFVEDHELVMHVPADEVPVTVDRRRIQQLLRNLLDNADKYSPAGEPINVHVVAHEDHAEVWVTDGGEGVAPEDAERIFQHYVRGDQATPGLGLGLAISRRIARAHDGALRVTDAPDAHGARFVLKLPLA